MFGRTEYVMPFEKRNIQMEKNWIVLIKTRKTTEKPLKMPDGNLACLWRFTADHFKKFYLFTFLMYKKKLTQQSLVAS